MKTQIEQIEWHSADENPKEYSDYLVHWKNLGDYDWVGVLWFDDCMGCWNNEEGNPFDMDIIAWAEFPNGWVKEIT